MHSRLEVATQAPARLVVTDDSRLGQRLDFDSRLPALHLIHDAEVIRCVLEDAWLEPGQAPPSVLATRLLDAKYQPDLRCLAAYEVQVARPGGPPVKEMGGIEVNSDGIKGWRMSADPYLPWLAQALDGGAVERFLGMPAGAIRAVTAVGYRPASRAVIRYQLDPSSGRSALFGKVLATDGQALSAKLMELGQAARPLGPRLQVLNLLGYWPEARLMVSDAVEGGVSLGDQLFTETQDEGEAVEWVYRTGQGLAALHTSPVRADLEIGMGDDVSELELYLPPIRRIMPAVAETYAVVLDRITSLSGRHAEPGTRLGHGAFRTDQVMMRGGYPVLMDLDGLCRANPARDVGNFLAYLTWKAIREPRFAARAASLGRAFQVGYAAGGPVLDPMWLALYQAASLLKIAGRRYRGLGLTKLELVPQLLSAAHELVAEGQRMP